MTSPYLGIVTVTEGQEDKEETINNADARNEEATQARLAVDMSAGDVALSEVQWGTNFVFAVSSGMVANQTLTVRNFMTGNAANTSERFFMVSNEDPTFTVTVTTGSGVTLDVLPKTSVGLVSDGTNISRMDSAMSMMMFVPAVPTSNQVLTQLSITEKFTLPVGLVGSRGRLRTAATAITAYVVQKNEIGSLGTIDFAASGQDATFTFTTATDFDPGDTLSILAPASPDATAAGFSFSFVAQRK